MIGAFAWCRFWTHEMRAGNGARSFLVNQVESTSIIFRTLSEKSKSDLVRERFSADLTVRIVG
jgi:hypothetical protein